MSSIKGFIVQGEDNPVKYDYQALENKLELDSSLSQAGQAADSKVVGDRILLNESYIISEESTELPKVLKGNFRIKKNTVGDEVICGTHNVSQLLNIKEGTFVINDVTITVVGNSVTVSGQPSSGFSFDFVSGTAKTITELAAMTLPLPIHQYTLSQKLTSGTVFPPLLVRGKSSGNAVVTQNNVAVFNMDTSTCGGLYLSISASNNYSCTFKIALLPYSATNGNQHREEESNITVYNEDNVYKLDGYAWCIGNPSITELRTKLPKKPKCVYSTRTIAYSSMTECLDIYIPTTSGYIDYIFGHTQSQLTPSEGGGNVWRLVQVNSVNDAFDYQFHITQLGETEMAIMISGRDDFIGGTTHGDEVMDSNSLLFVLDGKPVEINTVTSITEFDMLQIFLVSSLYDPNDHITQVGEHGREWRFTKDGLYLQQTVKFLENLTLSNTYMPMLCVLRGNDAASSIQVTDTYIDDGNFMQYNVGTGGFTTYPNQLKSDVKNIHLIGKTSGVEASLEIIEQPEGLNQEGTFLFNGVDTYNKIYCCICGYGGGTNTQNVSSGDKWHIKSKIKIDVK